MSQKYSPEFEAAFEHTLGLEGGYVNDPDDPGQETKFGISRRAYPHIVAIKDLTVEQAQEIYHRDYWTRLRLDELPRGVSAELFDTAVNMGTRVAVEILQRALVYFGHQLELDGLIGAQTIRLARTVGSGDLLKVLNALQFLRYEEIIKSRPKSQKYAVGWLKRISFPSDVKEAA